MNLSPKDIEILEIIGGYPWKYQGNGNQETLLKRYERLKASLMPTDLIYQLLDTDDNWVEVSQEAYENHGYQAKAKRKLAIVKE